ncbi:hypothetical protein MPSEU_000702700 [Mayamaea pseudoterrestris]|nr:hypothetical protein MPSEU_000702700 [Mayamaea pseudoterrestris]
MPPKNAQKDEKQSSRGHVAEYFAILGVGEQLVWKHRQKQSSGNSDQHETDDNDEEEDLLLEERFMREIVDVAVIRIPEGDAFFDHEWNVLSNADKSTALQSNADDFPAVTPNTTDFSHESKHLLSSPSYSEATTSVNPSVHLPPNRSSCVVRYHGWELLHRTLPAGRTGYWTDESMQTSRNQKQHDNLLWSKAQTWEANIDWADGLRGKLLEQVQRVVKPTLPHLNVNKIVRKVESTFRNLRHRKETSDAAEHYYLAYKRRRVENRNQPAIVDVQLLYMRMHKSCLKQPLQNNVPASKRQSNMHASKSAAAALIPNLAGQFLERYQSQMKHPIQNDGEEEAVKLIPVQDYLQLPDGYDEWAIPDEFLYTRDPNSLILPQPSPTSSSAGASKTRTVVLLENNDLYSQRKSHICNQDDQDSQHGSESDIAAASSGSGFGVEVDILSSQSGSMNADALFPKIISNQAMTATAFNGDDDDGQFYIVPVLAVQRQRVDDEERFHETDSAIVELAVSFADQKGEAVLPLDGSDDDEDDGEDNDGVFNVLRKTMWRVAQRDTAREGARPMSIGSPVILARRNVPYGFADVAFATRVLGRFPYKNYKDFPLPEEELPMFCYPTGCRLHRARFSDAPLAECYGFVVKNERGDSIYISCVSFMEPLTSQKVKQLNDMSRKRSRTSLAHRAFCHDREKRQFKSFDVDGTGSEASTEVDSGFLLTGFDDMTTFEKKTICLVSRFPFWTAFRKFLAHLHILTNSTSSIPLERYISHLLLSVPVPKAGGPSVLVPLPALNDPLLLYMPPEKDFPLVDLPFQRLFACLDIKTIVTVVLGLLTLEHKVIVMSSRPSLVLDVCELLRALMFPFDLCAPYVPRLTEPFKSSLEFPGALFVGIHRDGTENGLAEAVRRSPPDDSIIINLDSGELAGDGDRHEIVSAIWDMIPAGARSMLVSELETLCEDADIIDGQEPLDSQYDSAFDVALSAAVDDMGVTSSEISEPLDDRAVRDVFLRFFCYILGGYERFLLVPDADFLVSGDDWFNAQGFVASASVEKRAYLTALVGTQLFQSFIQRRTEASDVHCMLFDESLAEFHSSTVPYGRLGGDVESVFSDEKPRVMFSLLVDQSAALPLTDPLMLTMDQSMDASEAESSLNMSRASGFGDCPYSVQHGEWAVNAGGDFVTAPSRQNLPNGARFAYCIDGNPCFPHKFQSRLFLPLEPDSWVIETARAANPLLARTERELEEGARRRRAATSHRGMQRQRRCLWQLPKLMGSHFLGAWLMCIPVQVSQKQLSNDQQSRFLMRALGALRLFRSRQRIVPDEAAYRALMVACGRTQSDRGPELMKLFGLLRSDGIFPSAVTLGQYTKALAEGYSKRQDSSSQDDAGSIEVTESSSKVGATAMSPVAGGRLPQDTEATLSALDATLLHLETHGRRWRQRLNARQDAENGESDRRAGNVSRGWLPVVYSTSIVPMTPDNKNHSNEMRLISMWSRTRGCSSCKYIPLEEEVMAGWDVVGGETEIPGAVACPRCDSLIVPMLGYKEMTLGEALSTGASVDENLDCSVADFGALPPQITPTVNPQSEDAKYIAYISPASLRLALEHYVDEYGEDVLVRDRLKALDPEIFYNFWWMCARFSLPLPLPVACHNDKFPHHCILFAAWDHIIAERGCKSAAKVLKPLLEHCPDQPFDEDLPLDAFDEVPFLSRFNLQGFFSTVWDHIDLSQILVKLVEACDKRDFTPIVDAVLSCNRRRLALYSPQSDDDISDVCSGADLPMLGDSNELSPSIELDVYRTILYLAKYQCTTAFHSFFPATVKPCKGYHFWCAIGTPLPMFDRLIRDGVKKANSSKEHGVVAHTQAISDVALGFRCVFGHLI